MRASQIENALGSAGGLLEQLTGRLDAPRDDVAGALGYLLPYIVGKLTPGGSLPGSLPAEIASVASAGQALLSAPLPSGGGMKWHRSAHPASGADQAEQGQPQTADQGDFPVQPGGQRRLAGRERGERGHNRGHNRQRRNGELLTPSR